ncbi:YafY family protein [Dactylosporangium fulvum]|uniref:YafY family transcriptional regulator n=1 Tax=Dactylosporangium fulvum TaxID=53359 RepID=A0ABY5W754_9ACTN|nr:YafY family protein [Dactylosporangium fulvum]UWP85362.1 YafY family transcriptional regulator [Dactylosporangium fulvum]
MRADRLLALLLRLQSRGRTTARELAAELEVSVRTVYRDLDALGAAGVPVVTAGGPGGGCWLLDGYRSPLLGLSADEATALLVVATAGPLERISLGDVLPDARRKLLAALPEGRRRDIAAAAGRFHLDAAAWFRSAEPVPHLAILVDAVLRGRRLRIAHRGTADAVVDPLGLVVKAGVWYLVVRGDRGVVAHRAGRISAARLLDEGFERPAGFDLAAFWARWTAEFEGGFGQVPVTVRLSPEGTRAAVEILGEPVAGGPVDADGWRTVVLRFDSLPTARSRLLGFGPHAEVLEPVRLRCDLATTARAIADRYRPADTPPNPEKS